MRFDFSPVTIFTTPTEDIKFRERSRNSRGGSTDNDPPSVSMHASVKEFPVRLSRRRLESFSTRKIDDAPSSSIL